MPQTLTPPSDPAAPAPEATTPADEADFERCLTEIGIKKRRVAEVEGDLARLQRALARFELLCQARVGDLLTDLQQVGETIARYRRQAQRLRDEAEPSDEPEPSDLLDAADAESDASRAEAGQDAAALDRGRTEDEEAEAKRLYRELAKRCHPDFARDDGERRLREAKMAEVNEAYRTRDLTTLRGLRHEIEFADPEFGARPLVERLAWAVREIQRLDAVLAGLRAEWMRLRRSDLHRLWRRYEAGEPVFEDLRDDLEAQLAHEADRLDDAIAAYRALTDEHPTGSVAAR